MANERKVKFKYVFSKDYNPVYCNGAYGGVSTHGELVINFFVERTPIPNHIVNIVEEDGSLSGAIETNPEDIDDTFIRFVSNGIILNQDSAESLHEWHGEKLNEMKMRDAIGQDE